MQRSDNKNTQRAQVFKGLQLFQSSAFHSLPLSYFIFLIREDLNSVELFRPRRMIMKTGNPRAGTHTCRGALSSSLLLFPVLKPKWHGRKPSARPSFPFLAHSQGAALKATPLLNVQGEPVPRATSLICQEHAQWQLYLERETKKPIQLQICTLS